MPQVLKDTKTFTVVLPLVWQKQPEEIKPKKDLFKLTNTDYEHTNS